MPVDWIDIDGLKTADGDAARLTYRQEIAAAEEELDGIGTARLT